MLLLGQRAGQGLRGRGMGLDYSYEIFVPARNVATALTTLTELAPPERHVPPLSLTLPGGIGLEVPYTSQFKSDPVDCSTAATLQLDTSIMVAPDDAVLEDRGGRPTEPDELGRIQVGYVYLTVTFASQFHPGYASLNFCAATSSMSRMFERSPNMRAVFTDLTAAGGGVCCLLDTESDHFTICWLNGRPVHDTVPGPRFPDDRALADTWPDPHP